MSATRWPIAPAAVALDLLADDERAVAARLLADDPAFRAEVERLRATGALLRELDAEAWAPVDPPPLRVLAPERPAARRRARRGVLAVAAACVVALTVAVLATRDRDPAAPETTVALRPLPGVAGHAELTLSHAGTEAELRGTGLRPSGKHDYYEAWLADDRGRMVSMGTFRVDRHGRVDAHMPVGVDLSRYTLVDVSLEPDDGDPAHSQTSVLRARL